jgi:hypothetical protein
MIRFLIAKKIAPLKKACSFRLPIISSPSVYKMVTTDLLFQIPRHGHEFIPPIKAPAEAPVSLRIPIRTQPTQVFLPASIHEAFAKISAEVQRHNLVLERAGVIYPPGHWVTPIQAPEVLNLFVVFSPYVRTDGKNYSAQPKHDRGQLGLFGGKLGPKKKNGARVLGGMSTGKGAVVTVWDALWPLLQPPPQFRVQ